MRELNETELFNLGLTKGEKLEIQNAINGRLNQGSGIIAPQHIEPELVQAKMKAKKMIGMLGDGISLYESFNKRIKLFNLGLTSTGRSPIPSYLPFIISRARNKQLESEKGGNPTSPAVYVNLYRIGKWSADEKTYNGLSPSTDLATALESGAMAYKLVYEHGSEKVFSDAVMLENLTRIYTSLFSGAVIRTKTIYGSDFNTDAARFIIAKFFLRYVLKKPETATVEDYAYRSVRQRGSTIGALKNFEENSNIDYSSLSKFLASFGMAFYGEEIPMVLFQNNWMMMYGEGLTLAIEYVPYLLHYLIALKHGAMLGGATKLYKTARYADIVKDGLNKVLNTLTNLLR